MRMREADKPFLIKFWRGRGSKKGTVKTVHRARSGFPSGSKKKKSRSHKVDFKTSALIPITDVETNQYITCYRPLICQFNNFKVVHS